MKTAKVVNVSHPVETGTPDEAEDRIERMSDLLRRYPAISEEERTDLLQFLTKGRQLEVGLTIGREGLETQVAAFRRDHAKHFRPSFAQYAGFLLLTLGPVALLAWYYLT